MKKQETKIQDLVRLELSKKGCKVFCYDSFFSHLKRIIAQNGAIFKLFGENYARNMKKSGAAHGSPAE